MRRFLAISLMLCTAVSAFACFGIETHNYYLFSVYKRGGFSERVNEISLNNWSVYTDGAIDSWYNADIAREAAMKKGDVLMANYVDNLEKYLDCARDVRNTWDYPTKAQLQQRQQTLMSIRNYASSKLGTRLRSQHALLFMRCNMLLNRHQENITFWEKTASRYIDTVYKEMMLNIYAGALLKSGRKAEAYRIFAEQEDEASLYTCFYEKRSLAAIRNEYHRDPNSPVLPFLVQDFANNAQEAYDAMNGSNWPGKLFVRNITKMESQQMCTFINQVLNEGKTTSPALWKSLQAWLQYLFFDRSQALASINEAVTMAGSKRIKDNARVLRLYIYSDQAPADRAFANYLAGELQWLEQKAGEERGNDKHYDNHYTDVLDRLTYQVLVDKFDKAGQPNVATALISACDESRAAQNRQAYGGYEDNSWNPNYSTHFFSRVDTLRTDRLEDYLSYLQNGSTPLDRYLKARVFHDDEFFHELLGTKYLRLGQWQQAITHLEKVSLDFINRMNIVPYMAKRSYNAEAWLTEQRMKMDPEGKVTSSQKLDFAREMQALESDFHTLSKAERQVRAYDLAVRYYQASVYGDAWYLTRYGKGIYDTLRVNELDMTMKADELLRIARNSSDFSLQEKSFYALAFVPTDSWMERQWNSEKLDYDLKTCPDSRQYKALQELARFQKKNATRTSRYVSHCDVLKTFMTYQ